MKKSVIIEGQKSRSSIRNGKSFNRMDQKSQLQIKKIIQASKTSERLDLSERNILSLNSQIADLNETLKGKISMQPWPKHLNLYFSASSSKKSNPKFTKWIRMSSIAGIIGPEWKQSHFFTRFIRHVETYLPGQWNLVSKSLSYSIWCRDGPHMIAIVFMKGNKYCCNLDSEVDLISLKSLS